MKSEWGSVSSLSMSTQIRIPFVSDRNVNIGTYLLNNGTRILEPKTKD